MTLRERFPSLITALPEADIPYEGIKGWIAQGEDHQIVFFEIAASSEVPEHSHSSHQWGIVVEGAMKLTLDGMSNVYRKGDEYLIPAHQRHSAKFLAKSRVIDFFKEKARYKPRLR